MKYILEFDSEVPGDQERYENAVNSYKLSRFIAEFYNDVLRRAYKYGGLGEHNVEELSGPEVISKLRDIFIQMQEDYEITD